MICKRLLLAVLCAVSSAWAGPVTVVSVTTLAGNASPFYSPSYLIDGSGLSGGRHDGNYQYHMWASDGMHSTATLDFDLGALWILDNALVWNYNWEVMLNRGARGLTILVSSNGVDYNTVGDFTLTRGTGGLIPADVLALEGTPARYVRFSLTSNYGDTGYIGLSEVQFDGSNAVPEPASGLLVLLGLSSGAGWRALRQRVRNSYLAALRP